MKGFGAKAPKKRVIQYELRLETAIPANWPLHTVQGVIQACSKVPVDLRLGVNPRLDVGLRRFYLIENSSKEDWSKWGRMT